MAFWKRKEPARPAAEGPATPAAAPPAGSKPRTEFLRGDEVADRRSVQVLLDAIARVSESRDIESLLDYCVDRSIEVTGAERGFLVLLDKGRRQTVRVARIRGGRTLEKDVKYSTTVVKRVLAEDTPMRTTVQSDAEALELGTSVFDLKLRAVMCVPLTPTSEGNAPLGPSGEQRGVLYVDSKAATREFKDEDLALFAALAQHIAIALENARLNIQSLEKARLEESLEIARSIQSDLMPKVPKTIAGLDVHGWYQAAEHASGDFYDFVPTRGGGLAVVVGDVTGHGIGPALITATAQASLRSYARVLDDPVAIIDMLNQDLAERMDDGIFLTLFLALFSSQERVRVINAGHTPPLLWRRASGTVSAIGGHGPALGMISDFHYGEASEYDLAPGDALVVFTDGLVEARHASRPDRLFGESEVRAVLADIGPRATSAREVAEALVDSVRRFSGGALEDDVTVVAVRRSGG